MNDENSTTDDFSVVAQERNETVTNCHQLKIVVKDIYENKNKI